MTIVNGKNKTEQKVVRVAAAIIQQGDCFLLSKRLDHLHQGGKWEFPGGKIELNETVSAALVRELQEELGIDVQSSEELTVLEHDYPHAYVRLYVSIIRDWKGAPIGREGQALSWEFISAQAPSVGPLLPAAWPMLECLRRSLA